MTDKKTQQKLESLYRDYKDDVFNYLYRITSDYDLAMDVTQIAFTKAFQDPKLMDVRHIKAYLLTIGRNTLYDEWKRKKEIRLSPDESGACEPVDDPLDRPLQQVAQADMQNKVESAITLMQPRMRELMILRYTEDLSIKEIAQITQRTESDVKVSLHRARIRFERDFESLMYSRVAKSRDRCDELNRLLAPYEDRELPADALKVVDRHLASCDVCEQDKQAMKKSRELFAALPLIPAPLALDDRIAEMFQPDVSGLPADQAPPVASEPGISTVTVIQTTAAKWLAGVVAVAILGGAGTMLLKNIKQDDQAMLAQNGINQGANAPASPPAQQGQPGKVTLMATNAKGVQSSANNMTWKVYQVNGQTRRLVKNVAQVASPTLELPAGKYRLVVNQGPYVKQEVDLTVKEGETRHQSIVLESGRINLSAQSVDSAQVINKEAINKIQWHVYSNFADALQPSQKHITRQHGKTLSLVLPPGPYTVVAKLENAEISREFEVTADQLLDMPDFSFAVGKLVLAARRTTKGPVIEGVRWRIYQLDENNKERIIETRHGDRVSFILPPGAYHAQARYKNSVIDTEVVVEPGKTLLRENIILGSGTLQLSSRLSPDSPIQKGVRWQVYTSRAGIRQKIIASKHGDTVSFDLPQGQYHIIASYKKAQVSTEVEVVAGKQAKVDDLILNAGVVTMRSRLSPDSPIQKGVRWSIYSLNTNGNTNGNTNEYKNIIASQHGDKVSFTLPVGKYQILASFAKASANTQVTVLAGKEIKADDLILDAGTVTMRSRLSANSPIQTGVRWVVYSIKGNGNANGNKNIIASQHGDTVSFTLPTGKYLVEASYGKARANTEVEVVAGKTRDGNDVLLNAGRLILSSNLEPGRIRWQVYQEQKNGKRELIISKFGAGANFVLPAGSYRVSTGQGKEAAIKKVGIVAGKVHRQHFDMKK